MLFTSYSYFQALSHLPIKCSKLVCSVILTHTDTDLVRALFFFLHHIISLKIFFSRGYQLLTFFILLFLLKLFLILEQSLFVGKRKSVFRKVFRCILLIFLFIIYFVGTNYQSIPVNCPFATTVQNYQVRDRKFSVTFNVLLIAATHIYYSDIQCNRIGNNFCSLLSVFIVSSHINTKEDVM